MIGYTTCNILDFAQSSKACIVNAANRKLTAGGGVCGVIHAAAGPDLELACNFILKRRRKSIKPGSAVLTHGGNLPCKIIHAVGPIFAEYTPPDACKILAKTYMSILDLASQHNITGIVIPAISCGIYGFPIESACKIAVTTVHYWSFINPLHKMDIILSAFDPNIAHQYRNRDLIEII
jgi:O-acetyl-ADP-ribose deacetylase (regulator of RNase III)